MDLFVIVKNKVKIQRHTLMKIISKNLSGFIINIDHNWNRVVEYRTHILLESVIRSRSKEIWFSVINTFL